MAPTSPLPDERDPKDDADARAWARDVQDSAEAGKLTSDADWLREKAAQEKRRLKRR